MALPEANLLFIEQRNADELKVEFAALDYRKEQFLWKQWRPSDNWLVSLFAVQADTLFLQEFPHRGNPDQKNLIACDIWQAKIRWIAEGFSFSGCDGRSIYGYQIEEERPQAIVDIRTGERLKQPWFKPDWSEQTDLPGPIHYVEGTAHFESVRNYLQMKINRQITAGVDYMEYGESIIMSVYFRESAGLANYLFVFSQQGDLVLKEVLDEKLGGIGTDTFFVLSGCLFFVKNKLELVAYTL